MSVFLTTKELADLLRIKERKVYDLVAKGEVPCSRATGKLLFPRDEVLQWAAAQGGTAVAPRALPNVLLGSLEPLLEEAVRASGCGIATYLDGSLDGLSRFEAGEGIAAGLHVRDPESGEWNLPLVRARLGHLPVVLMHWARRQSGLLLSEKATGRVAGLSDLRGLRLVTRQPQSGAYLSFRALLEDAGLDVGAMDVTAIAGSESEVALTLLENRADAGFGLQHLAERFGLGFLPLIEDSFDLVVNRRAWFEPPFQALLRHCRCAAFLRQVEAMAGYDISGLGEILFNGP
ncbi:MAG: helix-turn-helix transcriptional regulator [Paracoccaceae bacterium]